jgi:hypothetical protein
MSRLPHRARYRFRRIIAKASHASLRSRLFCHRDALFINNGPTLENEHDADENEHDLEEEVPRTTPQKGDGLPSSRPGFPIGLPWPKGMLKRLTTAACQAGRRYYFLGDCARPVPIGHGRGAERAGRKT